MFRPIPADRIQDNPQWSRWRRDNYCDEIRADAINTPVRLILSLWKLICVMLNAKISNLRRFNDTVNLHLSHGLIFS